MSGTFFLVANSLIKLCICMMAGFIGKKSNIITNEASESMSQILLKITMPCLIIVSMQRPFSFELLSESILVFVVMLLIIFFGMTAGILCCRILKAKESEKGCWIFVLSLPNVLYMGLPLIQSIYGESALFYVYIVSIAFNLVSFSVGLKVITIGYSDTKMGLMPMLKNNALIATVIGLILFIFSIKLPESINSGLLMVGNMTTPISMLLVGALLAKGKISEIFSDINIYFISFIRLIAIPLISFFIMRIFIKNVQLLSILTILAAMPAATLTAIFAEQYRANSALASKLVFISTLLSIVTIPFVSLFL